MEVLVNGHLSGSGWFARADGLVVTAAHLFERRDADVEILSARGGRLACALLALDRGNDIALLKTKGAAVAFPVLEFASDPPRIGEEIFQFGAPLFRSGVLQPGRVAREDTAFEFYSGRDVYVEVIHVAAMMQGGTSGGPWLDHHGNVVGLQSGMMSMEGKPVGIAYVVPAAPIRALLKTLCDAATPDAGFWVDHLWERDEESLKQLPAGTEGLTISGVRKDGPAAQAGVLPGDVVIAADGKKVIRIRELLEIIRARKPGEPLKLTLLRAGTAEPLPRTVTLDRAEVDIAQTPLAPVPAPFSGSPSVPYGTGTWDATALGNHRAVLGVAEKADVVWAHVPWRRRDTEPEKKNLILVEAGTNQRVTNLLGVAVSGSSGDIAFQAPNGGTYYLYYLPCISRGKNYPTVAYQPPQSTADPAWLARNGLGPGINSALAESKYPHATVVEMQAIDQFDSFYPMEVAATAEEESRLVAAHPGKSFLLFPEDRSNPIRMTDHLPLKWITDGPRPELTGVAACGEFFAFQLGLYAAATNLGNISLRIGELRASQGGRGIPAAAIRCFNTGGTNWNGAAFTKPVSVEKGRIQALWFGVQVPKDLAPGQYQGQVTIKPAGLPAQSVKLALTVTGNPLADSGDDEPGRLSRLRWLDSTLASDDGVVRPFTPVRVVGDTLEILGRRLAIGPAGFPAQVSSYFSPEVTRLQLQPKPLLVAPLELVVEDSAGQRLQWRHAALKFTKQTAGAVAWCASSTAGPLRMEVCGTLEFDGFAQFKVTLSATRPVELGDIRLEIPLAKEVAKYMMGLGLQGRRRPTNYEWGWDVKKDQDSAWLGDADAGLQFKLKDENYARPLLTNFYEDSPLHLPPSWFNEGRGGISIREPNGSSALVRCYSGRRALQPGRALHFNFDLLLTPFKPLDTQAQWHTRFFHSFRPVDEALRSGANTINIHHANEANPYINYPFLHVDQLRAYVDGAHQKGLKVKIYYTIRELSNHAAELFALRSLGDEIFPQGQGGGDAWLPEHLGANYIPGWFVPQYKDAAIINRGTTRWDNYYVAGLDWLVRHVGIDGLYIDDLAFDRLTMKRVRKVLDRDRPGSLIDFHSANQFNPRDGFGSCANVYLEHFPYLNRLWFGEYFDPNSPPDFWLIEMSGIPFGLMGEMLEDGGNRWRGMLFGMTSRMSYQGNDPSPLWKVWDDFRIQDSEMYGYWSSRCPVRTDNPKVLATVYVGSNKTLVSLASWAAEDVQVRLSVNWRALGIDPTRAVLTAPAVAEFQSAARFSPNDPIPVPKGKGWLLIIAPVQPAANQPQ